MASTSNETDTNDTIVIDTSMNLASALVPFNDIPIPVNVWPDDVDIILEKIRCNSIIMSEYHKANYFFLHSRLKYFRIPIIIISAFASVLNIGLQPFLDQLYISILCCLLSLVTGLIGSIEMFLQVQKKMENELINSRDFYLNAIEIFKVLSLEPIHRNGDGLKFLDAKFSMYIKMIENSNIMEKEITDQLAPIDPKLIVKYTGNINNAGVLLSRGAHKVNKRVRRRVKKMGDMSLTDLMFLRFFWKDVYEDDSSIDSEDRFQLYYDIMQKVNSKEIDKEVLDKIAPLLTFSENKNEIKMDDRMRIYSILEECGRIDPKVLAKMRIILIEEYFQKPNKRDTMHRLNSYETMDTISKTPDLFKMTAEIHDIGNEYDRSRLNSLRPLDLKRGRNQSVDSDIEMGGGEGDGNHRENIFIASSHIDDD